MDMQFLSTALLFFGILGICMGQEEEYIWNGTHQVLVPEKSQLTPEIYYNFISQGLLDGNHFLPGEFSPLSKQQIKAELDKLMSEDPYLQEFYTIRDFPDKKFPVLPSEIPNPLTCFCTDVQPQTYLNEDPSLGPIEKLAGLEVFPESCLEAVEMGLCSNSTFITDLMPVIVEEGFCERSCGRCDCCESLLTIAEQYPELSLFLEVVEVTGLTSLLASPATEATVLAPSNAAMEQALETLGIAVENIQDNVDILKEILLFHILPPHPFYLALWTTPFFLEGVTSDTLLSLQDSSIPPLYFRSTEENETFVAGPSNFGEVIENDIEACKGFLNIIDAVLLPFEIDSADIPAPLPATQPSPSPIATNGDAIDLSVGSGPLPSVQNPTTPPSTEQTEAPPTTIGSIFSSFIRLN